MTPDVIYDQLIGAGCAARLVFSWGGNPGVGSLHRLRDAVEHGWPRPLALEEYSHGAMAERATTPAPPNLPFAMFRTHAGQPRRRQPALPHRDLPVHRRDADRRAGAAPRRHHHPRAEGRPRGQRADRRHHRRAEGSGRSRRAGRSSRSRKSSTRFDGRHRNACILPRWTIAAIAVVPGGALPVVRLRLLRARQRVLPGVGRDLARRARASRRGSTST